MQTNIVSKPNSYWLWMAFTPSAGQASRKSALAFQPRCWRFMNHSTGTSIKSMQYKILERMQVSEWSPWPWMWISAEAVYEPIALPKSSWIQNTGQKKMWRRVRSHANLLYITNPALSILNSDTIRSLYSPKVSVSVSVHSSASHNIQAFELISSC